MELEAFGKKKWSRAKKKVKWSSSKHRDTAQLCYHRRSKLIYAFATKGAGASFTIRARGGFDSNIDGFHDKLK
jgi:hypothetical protein